MTEEKTNTGGKVQTAAVGERLQTEERIIEVLRTVFDPEIPVNIYDLGLIYRIELDEAGTSLSVDMTLTAPSCPAADGHDERGSPSGVGTDVRGHRRLQLIASQHKSRVSNSPK